MPNAALSTGSFFHLWFYKLTSIRYYIKNECRIIPYGTDEAHHFLVSGRSDGPRCGRKQNNFRNRSVTSANWSFDRSEIISSDTFHRLGSFIFANGRAEVNAVPELELRLCLELGSDGGKGSLLDKGNLLSKVKNIFASPLHYKSRKSEKKTRRNVSHDRIFLAVHTCTFLSLMIDISN